MVSAKMLLGGQNRVFLQDLELTFSADRDALDPLWLINVGHKSQASGCSVRPCDALAACLTLMSWHV